MNVQELIATLQNLTNGRVIKSDIARALAVDPAVLRRNELANRQFKLSELQKLEAYFNVKLLNTSGQQAGDNYVDADYYTDAFGSCGNGIFALSQTKEKISIPRKVFDSYSKSKAYSVINAIGDSMLPFIENNDKLVVEHWNGEQIKDNHVYVFCFGNEIFVKRLAKNINEVVIKSDNKDYNTILLRNEEIEQMTIIGQIVGLMRKV